MYKNKFMVPIYLIHVVVLIYVERFMLYILFS